MASPRCAKTGRFASFPLQRIGRVFAPIYSTRPEKAEEAFDEIHDRGQELALLEPRLRDEQAGEDESLKIINDAIDSLAPRDNSDEREAIAQILWSLADRSRAIENANRQIEGSAQRKFGSRSNVARAVLDHFGYLDFAREQVTERGKWLADLRVDRPLLIGEALQRNLFASLDVTRAAALIAALAADEDRDYGELELDDAIVSLLVQFEEISFEVSTEEWKQGIEAAPRNKLFSRCRRRALGRRESIGKSWFMKLAPRKAIWCGFLSRTGEALLQIAGLARDASAGGRRSRPEPPKSFCANR